MKGYAATFEARGCTCEALIAHDLKTCCSPIRDRTRRSFGHDTLKVRPSRSSLRGRKSTGGSKNAYEGGAELEESLVLVGARQISAGR